MNVQALIKALQVVPNPSVTEVRVATGNLKTVAGDFTGGASEDLFTLAAHGFSDNDRVMLIWESAAGVVTGAAGDIFYIDLVDANTFHLSLTSGGAAVENTADGTAVLLELSAVAASIAGASEAGIDDADAGYVTIG